MGRHCIGVDVGGTTVKIGIFETDGTLLKKWEVPTRKEEGGKYIMEDVAASIRKTIEEMGIKMEDVLGAGLGVPGPVMPDGYVEVCVNLGWRNVNPQRTLSRFLDGLPVKSGNDATWQLWARCGWAAAKATRILSWSRWEPAWAAASSWMRRSSAANTAWAARSAISASARTRRNTATAAARGA